MPLIRINDCGDRLKERPKNTTKFILNKYGGQQLVVEGYKFNRNNTKTIGKTLWKCADKSCRVYISLGTTLENGLPCFINDVQHNHPPTYFEKQENEELNNAILNISEEEENELNIGIFTNAEENAEENAEVIDAENVEIFREEAEDDPLNSHLIFADEEVLIDEEQNEVKQINK
uniref:FLYWCH-type domain-containing protein n=1 Tax=Meloidogyne hapla TaxID=6305 RepID=A0A1I8BQ25_MELHA